ncbi:MAG: SRPBCC domain-containing protein [Anaerolineae bacterium]
MTNPILESFLTLRRTFAAPRDRVFHAWTDARAIERWFKPAGNPSAVTALDLRVGGGYCIEVRFPEGDVTTIAGTYVEIARPEKLVFTWLSELTDDHETLVTLDFVARAAVTEVILTHARFTTEDMRDRHQFGWTYMLDEMRNLF